MSKLFKILLAAGIISMLMIYMSLGFYYNWKNEQKLNHFESELQIKSERREQLYLEMKNLEFIKKSLAAELVVEQEKARQKEIIMAQAAKGSQNNKVTTTNSEILAPPPKPSPQLLAAQQRVIQRQTTRRTRAS